jgi:hypothetical protein
MRYCRSSLVTVFAAGSTLTIGVNFADLVRLDSTVKAWLERIVTVAAFWFRPIRTVGSACRGPKLAASSGSEMKRVAKRFIMD